MRKEMTKGTEAKAHTVVTSGQRRERLSYGVKEAAEALGLGRSTLYEMMSKGTLAFVKVGNRRLIPANALHGLIDPQLNAA